MRDLIAELRVEQVHQREMAQEIQRERLAEDSSTAMMHGDGHQRRLTGLRQLVGASLVRIGTRLQGVPYDAMTTSNRQI